LSASIHTATLPAHVLFTIMIRKAMEIVKQQGD